LQHISALNVKSFERCMSQTGWPSLKITLNIVSTDFLNNSGHLIKALILNESFELPNVVDCESLDTLIILFNLGKFMPSISSLKNLQI
jgi:hypothetical protein